jgi:phospholipase C
MRGPLSIAAVIAAATAATGLASAPVLSSRTGGAPPGLEQIEHIVIFMQENRPLDHYFGQVPGVRGLHDRAAHPLRTGLPAFYQPVDPLNLTQYLLPYHVSTLNTSAWCMDAPAMAYPSDILIWDGGRQDAWNTGRLPGFGQSYFNASDLAYYYALIGNWLVGDHYYQST